MRVSQDVCFFFFVTVNLADNGSQKVDMTHFDVLENLGTGGKKLYLTQDIILNIIILNKIYIYIHTYISIILIFPMINTYAIYSVYSLSHI